MGVNQLTDILLREYAPCKPVYSRMVLMGDLFIRPEFNQQYKRAVNYYKAMGFALVVSMDINGKATVKVDLGQPLGGQWNGVFNILVNGGTGEHIEPQDVFYRNCHNVVSPGGVMLHVGPEQGWPGHSNNLYNERWYRQLCQQYGYTMLHMQRNQHKHGTALYVVCKKGGQ